MKQPEVFKKIGGIIQEIQEQYEYLQANAENLNDLELELFVANTHFLKDHAEILRKLNLLKQPPQPELPLHVEKPKPEPEIKPADELQPIPKFKFDQLPKPAELRRPVEPKKPTAIEPRYFEPVVQQKTIERPPFKPEAPAPVKHDNVPFELVPAVKDEPAPQIDLSSDTPADSYAFERREPETIRHELVLDDTETWDEEDDLPEVTKDKIVPEPLVATEVETQPKEQITEAEEPVPTNPEPVIDNTAQSKPEPHLPQGDDKPLSFNQRMAAQLKERQTENTAEAPISDIKAAINLNDKMLFIKELFNGYPLSYSEAIEIVNRFKSFEEADRFLKTNYVTKNNWEAKKAASDKFYSLLRRRYA